MNLKPSTARRAVSAYFFLSGLCFASWASRIPDISHGLGLSEGDLGTLLLALPAGALAALPFAGWAVHRWGSRQVLFLSALLYSIALPVLGLAPDVWTLAPGLVVFGFGFNIINISVNTQAINVQAYYPRPIMASFHGLWSLAGFLGGGVGAWFVRQSQTPLVHFALVGALCLLITLVAFPFTIRQDVGTESSSTSTKAFGKPDGYLLRLGLIAFCGMICEGCMFDWSGVYFQRVVKVEPALVNAGYIACMSMMASGRFVADYVTHRIGPKSLLRISSGFIAGGLLLAVALPTLPFALAGFLLVGLGIASTVPLAYSAAGNAGSMAPGPALALVTSIGYSGFLFGPPLIGYIAEATSLRASFALVACLGAAISILSGAIRSSTTTVQTATTA